VKRASRRLAGLDAAPEPSLGGDEKVLVEGIGRDGQFDPFASAGDDGERGRAGIGYPHVVLKLGHVLLFGDEELDYVEEGANVLITTEEHMVGNTNGVEHLVKENVK
jgi:hypothetical protein